MLPTTPTNFIIQQANAQVLASWDYVAGATSYSLQRSVDQITYTVLATITGATEYVDTAVTPGTQYWYKVASVNGSGTGQYTTALSAVPTITGHMTLGQIRLLSQQKADRVNSNFITKEEWNTYINQSYFELYDLLVQKYGNEYYINHVEFSTTGGPSYPLPDGLNYSGALPFFKLLGMDLNIAATSNGWLTLKKYEFISRNRYVYPQLTTNLLGVGGMRYRLLGNEIHFIPNPAAGQTLRMWYIPRMVELLQDTDQVDGVSGWTEYIVIDAAIKALQKEESDVSVLAAQKVAMIDRIEAAAENRDAGEPEKISDTRRIGDPYGWGFGGGDGPIGGW